MKVIGNLQVHGNHSLIKIGSEFDEYLQYSGFYGYELVGENIDVLKGVYFNPTYNAWFRASCDDLGKMPCRGITLEAGIENTQCLILKWGSVRMDSVPFNSSLIYISTNGNLTTTIPSFSGALVQIIGSPISENVGYLDFTPTFIQRV